MSGPEYVLNGRTYKTVAGLSRALFKDSGCSAHSMVDRNRVITCYSGRGDSSHSADGRTVVARYRVSEPKLGEPMTVTRIPE